MWRRAIPSPAMTTQTFGNFEPASSHAHSPRQRIGLGRMPMGRTHDIHYSSMTPNGSSSDPSDILRSMPCTEALLQQAVNVPSPSDVGEVYDPKDLKDPESISRQVLVPIKVSDKHNPTGLALNTQPFRSNPQSNRLPSSDLNQLGDIENNLHLLQREGEGIAPPRLPRESTNSPLAGESFPAMETFCMDGASDIVSGMMPAPATLKQGTDLA